MNSAAPVHVIHVTEPVTAGVAKVVLDLVSHQLSQGMRVSLVCPAGSLASMVKDLGGEHRPWIATRGLSWRLLAEAISLRRAIQSLVNESEATAVHLHSSKAGLLGRLRSVNTLPVLFQPHGWSFLAGGRFSNAAATTWERFASSRAALTVCVSAAEQAQASSRGVNRGNQVVLANAVNSSLFNEAAALTPSEGRAKLGLNNAPTVVCLGRICRQKGQELLIHLWPEVLDRVPDAQLFFVGDGPDLPGLSHSLPTNVHMVGWSDETMDWLAASDMVASPSRWEGMSLTVLEAMAAGRPVVASDAAGMRELLRIPGCEAGAVVPISDLDRFGAEIVRRLTDADVADRESRNGRVLATTRFDLVKWASALTGALVGITVLPDASDLR